MAKKLGRSPKEKSVSVEAEARELLWGAVPQQIGDNRKSWLARAARLLDWNPRRVRAVWNCEARVISAQEMRQLEERFQEQQERAAQRQKVRDELSAFLSTPIEPVRVAQQACDRAARPAPARSRPMGEKQGRFSFLDDK